VPASINRGVPIVFDEPSHPVSQALRQFAERDILALATAGQAPKPVERRGLLRRKVRTS